MAPSISRPLNHPHPAPVYLSLLSLALNTIAVIIAIILLSRRSTRLLSKRFQQRHQLLQVVIFPPRRRGAPPPFCALPRLRWWNLRGSYLSNDGDWGRGLLNLRDTRLVMRSRTASAGGVRTA